jgi:hypothetical protein
MHTVVYPQHCPYSAYHQDCHVPRAPAPGEGEGASWVCRQCVFAIATKVKVPLCPCVGSSCGLSSVPASLRSPSVCPSAEGRRTEERSLCPGHAGHEALPAIRIKRAGLGCWTFEQQTAELLLLWRPWRVSGEGVVKLWDGGCCGGRARENG